MSAAAAPRTPPPPAFVVPGAGGVRATPRPEVTRAAAPGVGGVAAAVAELAARSPRGRRLLLGASLGAAAGALVGAALQPGSGCGDWVGARTLAVPAGAVAGVLAAAATYTERPH